MELEYNNDAPSGAEEMLNAIRDREKTYKEEDLSSDLNWLEASGKIYQMNNDGEKFQGDHKALAKYGIDQMSEFNYNVSLGTIPDVMKVEKADHDTQVAFAYMMDTYDKKDITLDGVGRAFKEAVFDPLNWAGALTLGSGLVMKKGAEYVAKEGFKNRLHGAIRSYLTSGLAVGATEGALYSAGDEVARESVYQDADLMDGYSGTNIAAATVAGAATGYGVVKGLGYAGKGIGKGIDYVRKQGEEAMAQVAGGGTPNRGIGEIWGNGFSSRIAKKVPINQLDSNVKRGEFKDRMQFYNPVKLTNGDRISGFNEIGSDVLYGYDKNNELFTIDAEKLSKNFTIDMEQKRNNAPAQETAKILEEYLRNFKKETK